MRRNGDRRLWSRRPWSRRQPWSGRLGSGQPWSRRRPRLRRPRPGDPVPADRRVGDAERARVAVRLGAAQREGRFGSSDLYERRLAELATVRRASDVARLTADLEELVPAGVRDEMLRAVARAHAEGTVDFAEFCALTDRCLGAVRYEEAGALVRDIGYELERPGARARPAWWPRARRLARRTGWPALVGGVAGVVVVALPAGVDLPGQLGQWLPLALGTGAFTAAGSAVAALAWSVRRPRPWPTGPDRWPPWPGPDRWRAGPGPGPPPA